MEVASLDGWKENPALVLDFYNKRRRQLREVQPNAAHLKLVELESKYEVVIVTQNVDDLHERAGSRNIIHLHGELTKARSTGDSRLVYHWPEDIKLGDTCEKGSQLRPHTVWLGEMVPMIENAPAAISDADIAMIVGTSMQVYPAAGLIGLAPAGIPIYYIDPQPAINHELSRLDTLKVIAEKASSGVRKTVDRLLN